MSFDSCSEGARSLRDMQKIITRSRIVNAAIALLDGGGEEAVTIRAVAARANVTERTVFRHIVNRDGLLDAVWLAMNEVVGSRALPRTPAALADRPRVLFPGLDKLRGGVRAYLYSGARRTERRRLDSERQQALVACVEQALEGLPERTLRRRAAIAQVLTSPYAWDLMQQAWGFDGKEAAEAAAEAVEIILNRRLPW
jgi:AcrR family transcriptional regulator